MGQSLSYPFPSTHTTKRAAIPAPDEWTCFRGITENLDSELLTAFCGEWDVTCTGIADSFYFYLFSVFCCDQPVVLDACLVLVTTLHPSGKPNTKPRPPFPSLRNAGG